MPKAEAAWRKLDTLVGLTMIALAALLVLGIGALQIMLDKGQQEDWLESRFIVTLAVIAGVGLVALVVRETRAEHPIVDLSVFRNRTFAAGVLLITVLGFVLYGSTVLLPLFMQTLLGYSAFDAGLAHGATLATLKERGITFTPGPSKLIMSGNEAVAPVAPPAPPSADAGKSPVPGLAAQSQLIRRYLEPAAAVPDRSSADSAPKAAAILPPDQGFP